MSTMLLSTVWVEATFILLIRRNEALSSIPCCAAWIFSVPPAQCQSFLSFDWCVGNGLIDACSYVWWPGVDSDIESQGSACSSCQKGWNHPSVVPLTPKQLPVHPWQIEAISILEDLQVIGTSSSLMHFGSGLKWLRWKVLQQHKLRKCYIWYLLITVCHARESWAMVRSLYWENFKSSAFKIELDT